MTAATDREHATTVVTAEGEVVSCTLKPAQQVALWSGVLHQGVDGLVEVVAARRQADGQLWMRKRSAPQRYPQAGDRATLAALAQQHTAMGEEVFATPLTRRLRQSGLAGGIEPAHVCWVDIDDPDRLADLRAFRPRPHLVVYSGSGGAHGYWRLAPAVSCDRLEAINRTLAKALGGDRGSMDRARIMRLPGTINHKAGQPCRLAWANLAAPAERAEAIVGDLADPDPPAPPPTAAELRRHRVYLDADQAAQLDPPVYFQALANVAVPARGGHIPCPLPDHDETQASCMVYATADKGWWCYGCQRGGAIYDLASLLAGGPSGKALRDEKFKEVRAQVQHDLGLAADAASSADERRPQRTRQRAEALAGGRR